ncbi:MAG: rRNA maturation RNase YbeY [Flavobacteriales bacterium]|nr:rRNA maturation RNase YbeY [Flavobacteriales bacterium]MBP9079519.1 rRNA maturation RNase YbeY [Flavobacteriales bacterium]
MARGGIIAFKAIDVTNAFRGRDQLRKWLRTVASDHGHAIGELTFVLLSDKALLPYNQRYLGHDEYTDVITFDLQTGNGISGDILISYDRIRDNARTFGASAQDELHRVMVHGLLHLLGHSDKSTAKRAAMRSMEDKYLALLK